MGAWALVAVLALATALRLYGLGEPNFWLDELHSLANSAGRRTEFEAPTPGVIFSFSSGSTQLTDQSTWGHVWRGMSVDSHPPIYFLLLNSWRRVFGDGEWAVRVLPVMFSILSLIPVAMIFREFRRPGIGIAAAAMLAVTFGHIRFAQENRPYSLAILLVSVSYWTFVKMLIAWDDMTKPSRRGWAFVYVGSTLAAVMTHYFAAAALLGQAVIVVTRARGAFRWVWGGLAMLATACFAIIWGSSLADQWAFITNQEWLQLPEHRHLMMTMLRVTAVPVRLLVWHESYEPGYLSSAFGIVILYAALLGMRGQTADQAKVFVWWYAMPLLFFAIVDVATGRQLLKHLRYLCIAAPGLVGLIVVASTRLRGGRLWAVLGTAGAAMLFTLHVPTAVNPRARVAARLIAQQWQPGDLLVFEAIGWMDWARQSYQTVRYYLPEYTQETPDVLLVNAPPDAPLKAAIAAYPRIIVVSSRAGADANPVPSLFHQVVKTGYVRRVGEIHLFEKNQPHPEAQGSARDR